MEPDAIHHDKVRWSLVDWIGVTRDVLATIAVVIVLGLLAMSMRTADRLSRQVHDLTMDRERTVAESDCIDRFRTNVTIASTAFAAEQGSFISTVLSLRPGNPDNATIVRAGAATLEARSLAAQSAVEALAEYVNASPRPVSCPLP